MPGTTAMTTRSIYPEAAYGVRPIKALLGPDFLCIFESEDQIRNMNPDQMKISKRGGYVYCRLEDNNRITISGEAPLVAVSEIVANLLWKNNEIASLRLS